MNKERLLKLADFLEILKLGDGEEFSTHLWHRKASWSPGFILRLLGWKPVKKLVACAVGYAIDRGVFPELTLHPAPSKFADGRYAWSKPRFVAENGAECVGWDAAERFFDIGHREAGDLFSSPGSPSDIARLVREFVASKGG